MPILSLIYAVSSNGVIGKEGGLPWHYPEDLKYFKRITNGHTVIMGRKTFDSVGRPLPGRCNIVVSKESAKHEAMFRARQDTAPRPIAKLDAQFERPLRAADEVVFVNAQNAVEDLDLRNGGLANPDDAYLVGLDEFDLDHAPHQFRKRGRGHPACRPTAHDNDTANAHSAPALKRQSAPPPRVATGARKSYGK